MEMADLITYAGQVAMSFEKASEMIEKFTGIEVSGSLIRSVTEETGEKVFKQDMARAEESYKKPEIAAPQVLDRYKKEGVLYIFTDGSTVNTTLKDKNGSSWREMKLGLVFWDGDSISRKDGKKIITKKEYVSFFGEVTILFSIHYQRYSGNICGNSFCCSWPKTEGKILAYEFVKEVKLCPY